MRSCWKRRRRRTIQPLFFLQRVSLARYCLNWHQMCSGPTSWQFLNMNPFSGLIPCDKGCLGKSKESCVRFVWRRMSPQQSAPMVRATPLLGFETASHADVWSWEARGQRVRSQYWLKCGIVILRCPIDLTVKCIHLRSFRLWFSEYISRVIQKFLGMIAWSWEICVKLFLLISYMGHVLCFFKQTTYFKQKLQINKEKKKNNKKDNLRSVGLGLYIYRPLTHNFFG